MIPKTTAFSNCKMLQSNKEFAVLHLNCLSAHIQHISRHAKYAQRLDSNLFWVVVDLINETIVFPQF